MEKGTKVTPRRQGRVSLGFTGEKGRSMTKQSFASGTKVDAILKRYATLGPESAMYGVFAQHVARMPFGVADTTYDYQAQLNRAIEVQQYFKALPSTLREKFGHNPGAMIAFMADPRNREECEELGLFVKQEKAPSGSEVPAPPKEEPKKEEKKAG